VGFLRRKPAPDFILHAQLAMQVHLFVQVGIELPPTKQHPEPSAQFSQHGHSKLSAVSYQLSAKNRTAHREP
jgi:hypothetical protein